MATSREIIERLRNVPMFSECSDRELRAIAKAAKETRHKAGTVIAKEGEKGIGLFLILAGTADVTIGGKRRAKLGPGDFFGEIALLDGGPRTATVVATSDMELLGLTEWVFRGLLKSHPSIATKSLQVLAQRIRTSSKAATL